MSKRTRAALESSPHVAALQQRMVMRSSMRYGDALVHKIIGRSRGPGGDNDSGDDVGDAGDKDNTRTCATHA